MNGCNDVATRIAGVAGDTTLAMARILRTILGKGFRWDFRESEPFKDTSIIYLVVETRACDEHAGEAQAAVKNIEAAFKVAS